MQTRWTAFEKKWEEKIMEPDSKEGTTTLVEHRIRKGEQTEVQKIWKERTERESNAEHFHTHSCRMDEAEGLVLT